MEHKPIQSLTEKLGPGDVREMPYWVRHFFIYVVKHCASLIYTWCQQLHEANKEASQMDKSSNRNR